MAKETWICSPEALAGGFIDEITGDKLNAVINGKSLIINSIDFDMDKLKIPESYRNEVTKEENTKMPDMTIKDFINLIIGSKPEQQVSNINTPQKQEEPKEVTPQAVNTEEIIANERARVAALEAIDCAGNSAITAIVNDAKANGRSAADIESVINVIKGAPVAPAAALVENMIADNKESGVDGVKSSAQNPVDQEKLEFEEAVESMKNTINLRLGGGK